MAENSRISWTDNTFNPWRGCTKVSPACTHCYADTLSKRNPGTLGVWGDKGTRVVASESMWREPVKWNKLAEKSGVRTRVFCASLADVFEDWKGQVSHSSGVRMWLMNEPNEHPCEWACGHVLDDPSSGRPLTLEDVRQRLFDLVDATPNLDWLLLTKRPETILKMWPDKKGDYIPEAGMMNRPSHRHNCWLGCSVENQEYAEKRIPEVLKCRDLAPVLFLSCEPLLGSLATLGEHLDGIDWVIAGGESGPNARPSNPEWFRSLRDQCQAAEVPYHFKQWGEWLPQGQGTPPNDWHDETKYAGKIVENNLCIRVGVKASGRLLDGVLHNEFPKGHEQ